MLWLHKNPDVKPEIKHTKAEIASARSLLLRFKPAWTSYPCHLAQILNFAIDTSGFSSDVPTSWQDE
jgi:hypothetical protein